MRQGFAIVLWVWLAISLGVYGYRLWRRVSKGPKSVRENVDALEGPSRRTHQTEVPPQDIEARAERRATGAELPSATAPDGGVPGPATSPEPVREHRRVEVATALTGITMPCELTPVINSRIGLERFDAVFSTTAATPGEVEAAVLDELRRLGFEIGHGPGDEMVAEQQTTRVYVRLFADEPERSPVDPSRFGLLPPGSVVVEFST